MNAIARISPVESGNFFVVDQILEARSHAPRAAVLLRLSDALIAAKCVQLQAACLEVGFHDGAHYLEVRHAAHCGTRSKQGALPRLISSNSGGAACSRLRERQHDGARNHRDRSPSQGDPPWRAA
jgi:hypothetical protein